VGSQRGRRCQGGLQRLGSALSRGDFLIGFLLVRQAACLPSHAALAVIRSERQPRDDRHRWKLMLLGVPSHAQNRANNAQE
jgi:hypothetical protein